ncbi:hypothetical protein [Micromonospora sp. NPDC050695]|uniref:hypothetical protein n=1 Tax=Micromonospora sp. NPDC050695 TaxID=3154938 RepID=UPI00340C2FB2
MTSETNTNTPNAQIKRVRIRNHADGTVAQHVTYADNRRVDVRQATNGSYRSRVSYGYDQPTGTYNAQGVTR